MAFSNVLINVLLLVFLCVPGYLLRKLKKLNENAIKTMIVLLIFVAQPLIVSKSFLTYKYSSDIIINVLIGMCVFASVMFLVLIPACLIFRRKSLSQKSPNAQPIKQAIFLPDQTAQADKAVQTDQTAQARDTAQASQINEQDKVDNAQALQADVQNELAKPADKQDRRNSICVEDKVYRFASMFGNTGYIGLPLITALFPGNDRIILYTSMCIVMFNILCWTVGVYIITGDKRYVSFKKAVLNPVPIAILITLPFFFMPWTVPTEMVRFFDILGSMTTPLSMLIMGIRLAEIPFREVISDFRIYIVCSLRLILAPVLTFLILKLLHITDSDLYNTLIAVSAMPCAAASIILAERFTGNSYNAIKAVLCSAFLCIFTIPLICMLFLI